MSQAMRVVRTRVLPEPAPARISADWSGRVTAASCSGLRFSRRLGMRALADGRFTAAKRTPKGSLGLRRTFADSTGPDRHFYVPTLYPCSPRRGSCLSALATDSASFLVSKLDSRTL